MGLITLLRQLLIILSQLLAELRKANEQMSKTSEAIQTLTAELKDFLTGEATDEAAKDAHIKDLEAREADAEARLAAVDADDTANAAAIQAEIDIVRALKTQANNTPSTPAPASPDTLTANGDQTRVPPVSTDAGTTGS